MKKRMIIRVMLVLAVAFLTGNTLEPELKIDNEAFHQDTITYDISSSKPLTGALLCAVYNEIGTLEGVSIEKNETPQTKWTVSVKADFEKGMSKMFFWNSVDTAMPWTNSISSKWNKNYVKSQHLTVNATIGDLLRHPAFTGFAEQILPWDGTSYDESMKLSHIASLMPYHSHVNPQNSVDALNRLIDDVDSGKKVFYDFYPG